MELTRRSKLTVPLVFIGLVASSTPIAFAQAASPSASPEASPVEAMSRPAVVSDWSGATTLPGGKKGQAASGIGVAPTGSAVVLAATGGVFAPYGTWTSEDGTAWQAMPLPKAYKVGSAQLRGTPEGVLVFGVGSSGSDGRLLSSADGRSWSQPWTIKGAFVSDVAAANGTYTAVGNGLTRKNVSGTVWRSTDGKKWKATSLTKPKDDRVRAHMVAVSPDGATLVVGTESVGPARNQKVETRAWYAPDGVTFSQANLPSGTPRDLEWGPAGFVLAMFDAGPTSLWVSGDGVTWSLQQSIPYQLSSTQLLRAADGRLVAAAPLFLPGAGTDQIPYGPILVGSVDGMAWCEVEGPTLDAGAKARPAVLVGGDTLIVGGVSGPDLQRGQPITWSGTIGTACDDAGA